MRLWISNILVGVALIVVLFGCNGGRKNVNVVEDTLAVQDVAPLEVADLILPDTMFQSAKTVKCDIEIADTAISGILISTRDMYVVTPGAFTFRKGSMRQADFGGRLDSIPTKIQVEWRFKTDEDYTETSHGSWGGGTGWTGQPIYVEWPDSCLARFRANGIITEDFSGKEIIVGSLSGRVYFIDYVSGKASRASIDTGNPIKGTISLDPTLNGNLYVGQGVEGRSAIGALVIDLYRHKITHFVGFDPKARRRWTAYDSSPIRVGQFLFRPGENGTIYKYLVEQGCLSLHSAARYTVGGIAPGIEASMAVYANYGYVADNAGNVICFNLNNLTPVWRYKLPDDTDATPVVAQEGNGVYLYVGSEVEHEGVDGAWFVKLDALNGDVVWKNVCAARRADVDEKHFDGGYYSTPLLGRGDSKDLVFDNCVLNDDGRNGVLRAMHRGDGALAYSIPLKYYAWSSPVGFICDDGKYYIVTGDCAGYMYLISAVDGIIIDTKLVGYNFESSPVVVANTLVVGSRGNTIFKMSIR